MQQNRNMKNFGKCYKENDFMSDYIIIFNAGSSSIKFSLFSVGGLSLKYRGVVNDVSGNAVFTVRDTNSYIVYKQFLQESGYSYVINYLLKWIKLEGFNIAAIGHRVVHGGKYFDQSVRINDDILKKLVELIPLAPLHQPHNIELIKACRQIFNDVIQIACFDTAFHRGQSKLNESYALPRSYSDQGIIKYGFHGLSYQYITSVLPKYTDKQKLLIAHLGSGASICAVKNLKSVATTMGFTPLDGLMMSTRCGNIDPGLLLYLLSEKSMKINELSDLLYHKSGLLGVSQISSDMKLLLESSDKKAKEAVDMFCYLAARSMSGLIPAIAGVDVIVFTAGIGESSPEVRKKICNYLSWLDISLSSKKNDINESVISDCDSKVLVLVIPTHEEQIMANDVNNFLRLSDGLCK
jgi:acetate kinase